MLGPLCEGLVDPTTIQKIACVSDQNFRRSHQQGSMLSCGTSSYDMGNIAYNNQSKQIHACLLRINISEIICKCIFNRTKTSTSHQNGSLIYNKCSSVHLYHRLPPSKVNPQHGSSKCNTMQHMSNLIFNLPNFSSLPVSLQANLTKHSTLKKRKVIFSLLPFKSPAKYAAGDSKRSGNGLKPLVPCPSWRASLVSMGGKSSGCFFQTRMKWSNRPKSAGGVNLAWSTPTSWKSDRKLCFPCVFVATFLLNAILRNVTKICWWKRDRDLKGEYINSLPTISFEGWAVKLWGSNWLYYDQIATKLSLNLLSIHTNSTHLRTYLDSTKIISPNISQHTEIRCPCNVGAFLGGFPNPKLQQLGTREVTRHSAKSQPRHSSCKGTHAQKAWAASRLWGTRFPRFPRFMA